jgi:hypothetical protein
MRIDACLKFLANDRNGTDSGEPYDDNNVTRCR